MTRQSITLSPELTNYLRQSLREAPVLTELRRETDTLGEVAQYQISPEQGQLMAFLVELIGARRILEIGTFTGYSTLACALHLPPEGLILTCDMNQEWTAIAQRYWHKAGVQDRIELHLKLAAHFLEELVTSSADSFDMAFIDADKTNYDLYYERCLTLVRPGGLILIDNVLWAGQVIDMTNVETSTVAIRTLNEKLRHDNRITLSMIPISDGLTLARRRNEA